MEYKDIIELVNQLDWSLSENIQNHAKTELINISPENCDLLIQPMLKNTWHNATLVIKTIGYPNNKKSLSSLIWLLQDLNWPGVSNAFDILKSVNKDILITLLESSIKRAYLESDYMWLGGIKYFLMDAQICRNDFKNLDIYDFLDYSDF